MQQRNRFLSKSEQKAIITLDTTGLMDAVSFWNHVAQMQRSYNQLLQHP